MGILISKKIAQKKMSSFSALAQLKKAFIASLIVHLFFIWVASYFPFFHRQIIYHAPLFVDIIKIPSPQPKKEAEKKAEKKSIVYKEPKKKTKKETKKEVKKKPPKKEKEEKKETPEPQQEKIISSVPQGKVSIEAAKFPFTYYLNIIQNKVTENWNPWGEEQETKEVIIYFRILKDGQISHTQIEKSSGTFSLDQSALRAVTLANPLPPLPQEYEEDYLGIHFGFTFELEMGEG